MLIALAVAILIGPAARAVPGTAALARFIVEFETPSLVRQAAQGGLEVERGAGGKLDLGCPEARDHLARIEAQHERFRRELRRLLPGARVDWEYRILFNGAAVATSRPDLLATLPGVVRVSPTDTVLFRPSLDASLEMIGASEIWDAAGGMAAAGSGVRIAIIDSGIDPDNLLFRPDGLTMPQGYPLGAVAHATAKIIAARAYFRPDDPVDVSLDEPNPRDHIGHGSHCAGIAAGRADTVLDVNGTPLTLSGVAPGASLLNYKVFYRSESGSNGAFEPELMAAFEDALADGADVISCSWGGPDPLVETPSAEVYRAAVDAGAVVIFAAGNEGSGAGTISYPGTLDDVLTVGSFDTGRGFAGRMDVAADHPLPAGLSSLPALKGAISPEFAGEPIGPLPLLAAAMVGTGDNIKGCEPFILDAFRGAAALVARGECPFVEKATNAWLAGAEAVVVYNDVPGESAIVMGGDLAPIPAVQLGNAHGIELEQWLLEHPHAAVQVVLHDVFEPYPRPEEERRISSFSSRGPTDRPLLKPEIAAPGRSILSADARAVGVEGPGWGVKQGTSMAAPHVAGAAAVLRGMHPQATAREVQALLVGSARLDLTQTPGMTCLDMGAGQLDLSRASAATAGVLPAALSFGEGPQGKRFEGLMRLFDLAGAEPRLVSWVHAHPDCKVLQPTTGTWVEPEEVVDVEIECPVTATPREYVGWMILEGPGPDVVLPYHLRVLPVRNRQLLLLDMSFATTAESPLAALYESLALAAGLDFETYRVTTAGLPPALAYLSRFSTVLVFTGDDQVRHRQQAGLHTLDLLSTYARKGGNLLLTGQGPLRNTDHPRIGGLAGSAVRSGHPLFDPYTLGLLVLDDYLAWSTGDQALPTGSFDLGPQAGGSGDLVFVGETVERYGPGLPGIFSRPVLRMNHGYFDASGRVGMVFDPYMGYGAHPGLEVLRHRAVVLGFGLERVGDGGLGSGTRQELLESLHDWVSERIGLSLVVEQYGKHVLVEASTVGAPAVSFEFDFGDGSPPLESNYYKAWYEYEDYGEQTITVLARAELGAADVARVTLGLEETHPEDDDPEEDEDDPAAGSSIPDRTRDCSCRAVGEGEPPRMLATILRLFK